MRAGDGGRRQEDGNEEQGERREGRGRQGRCEGGKETANAKVQLVLEGNGLCRNHVGLQSNYLNIYSLCKPKNSMLTYKNQLQFYV